MNDEQAKQTEFDPCEQALRDHADMIERSCKETPQLQRRIKRLRKAADRIQSLREVCKDVRLILLAEDGEVPTLDDDWTPLHGAIAALDGVLKEAADGK